MCSISALALTLVRSLPFQMLCSDVVLGSCISDHIIVVPTVFDGRFECPELLSRVCSVYPHTGYLDCVLQVHTAV